MESASNLAADGRPIKGDIRHGVFVVFEAPNDFIKRSLAEYGVKTDPTGRYAALWRPYHLVGMEMSVSVLRAGLLGQATGSSLYFTGDVVARAKRPLAAGEVLDGEGGYTVYGTLRPAKLAVAEGELPVGLAYDLRLKRPVAEDQIIHWADVAYDETAFLVRLRREMEAKFVAK